MSEENAEIAQAVADAAEVAAEIVADHVSEVAAEITEENNERAEVAEAVNAALVDAQMHSIEEQRRADFENEIRGSIAALWEGLQKCEMTLLSLTERQTETQATAQTAEAMAVASLIQTPSNPLSEAAEDLAAEALEIQTENLETPPEPEPPQESLPARLRRRTRLL